MNVGLSSRLVRAALMTHRLLQYAPLTLEGRHVLKGEIRRHDAPMLNLGVSRPRSVGMMLECSSCKLLARAAFIHHASQGHNALRHDAVLKGLQG